jgi:hypothetical protein
MAVLLCLLSGPAFAGGKKIELTDNEMDTVTAAGMTPLITTSLTLFYPPPFFPPNHQVTLNGSKPSVTGVLPLLAVQTTNVLGLIQTSQQLIPYFVQPGVIGFKKP